MKLSQVPCGTNFGVKFLQLLMIFSTSVKKCLPKIYVKKIYFTGKNIDTKTPYKILLVPSIWNAAFVQGQNYEVRIKRFEIRWWRCPWYTAGVIMHQAGFRTGPGKSWNFTVAFSRSGKSWKRATGPGKCWKFVKLEWKIWNVLQTVRRINIEILWV